MARHRVVDAPDESGDADNALEVDLHDVERRGVVPVRLPELERELVGEGRLSRVARPEERDVRLPLECERDLVREGVHPDDLRRVVERAIPDERVEHCGPNGTSRRYLTVPSYRPDYAPAVQRTVPLRQLPMSDGSVTRPAAVIVPRATPRLLIVPWIVASGVFLLPASLTVNFPCLTGSATVSTARSMK